MVPASDDARRRRAGRCGLLLLPLLLASLAGCTSLFNPYIDAERTTRTYDETDPFPELRLAAANAEMLRQKAQKYRDEHVVIRSLLSHGAFGAAAAGGIAALYGAHRDLVLGLGLGAASGVSYGQLFVGADKVTIYSAAGRALYCVVAAADSVGTAGKTLDILTTKAIPTTNPGDKKKPGGAYWQQDVRLEQLLRLTWGSKHAKAEKEAREKKLGVWGGD